jgi:glycosyltransferase involved in cell wall biosynthesis
MSNYVLLIAGINSDGPPQGGEHYKNQLISKYLKRSYNVIVIDTHHWRKRPLLLLKILYFIFFFTGSEIIISLTTKSSFILLRLFKFLNYSQLKKITYFTIGGNLGDFIKDKKNYQLILLKLKSILVQGKMISKKLDNFGIIKNVIVIPNFKVKVEIQNIDRKRVLNFFYLGTITKSKGIFELMEVFEKISSVTSEVELHFYGPLDLDQEGKELFQTKLKDNLNIQYKGYLKILNNEIVAYEILSEYCAMVFPSYYPGEGFPGVFLDAFNVGMPVIASDWNMHTEVIKDGYNGKIVATKNSSELEKAMMWFVENFQTEEYYTMCENARKSFDKYEYPKVLEEYFNDRNS